VNPRKLVFWAEILRRKGRSEWSLCWKKPGRVASPFLHGKDRELYGRRGKEVSVTLRQCMQCRVGLDQIVYLVGYGVLYLVSRTLFHA
jgi:hypothetical protein